MSDGDTEMGPGFSQEGVHVREAKEVELVGGVHSRWRMTVMEKEAQKRTPKILACLESQLSLALGRWRERWSWGRPGRSPRRARSGAAGRTSQRCRQHGTHGQASDRLVETVSHGQREGT